MTSQVQLAVRILATGMIIATAAHSQNVLNDPKRTADARKMFDALEDNQPSCEVSPTKPHFLYSLRLEAGYVARLPPSQFQVPGHRWIVLISITPQEGDQQPVYLSDVVQFSNGIGSGGPESSTVGSYWLGTGRYAVRFLMFDSRGDACRKNWLIDARLDPGTKKFKMLLPPGTVRGSIGSESRRKPGAETIGRVTILVHAASLLQRRESVDELSKSMLLDGLVALTGELPAHSARLVVFNLEQRKELFRQDEFTFESLPKVAQVLDAVKPAPIDYRAIQNPHGEVDLLETILNREIHDSEPSVAVVFLGPKSIFKAKPSPQFGLSGAKSRVFYLLCYPAQMRQSSTLSGRDWRAQGLAMGLPPFFSMGQPNPQIALPNDTHWTNYGPNQGRDSIEYAVDRLKGETRQVDSVESFANAVSAIAQLSGQKH